MEVRYADARSVLPPGRERRDDPLEGVEHSGKDHPSNAEGPRWQTSRLRGAGMASPCPRCGSTGTASVHHGFIHGTLRMFGYRLRRCSSCNRWRVLKRGERTRHHSEELTVEELRERFRRQIAEASKNPSAAPETPGGEMTSDASEKSPGPGSLPSRPSIPVSAAGNEYDDYHFCPRCGGSNYHRSRRRWYERLLRRRRMARCMQCNYRFPYPL